MPLPPHIAGLRRYLRASAVFACLAVPVSASAAMFGDVSTGSAAYSGPDHAEIDLLRPGAGASRIFVQATMADGQPALFLVDTGADISVISRGLAERLSLHVDDDWGVVQGLSGSASMNRAILDDINLGGMVVSGVTVAVDVPGMSETAGFMPLDGLLGNNVWSRFVLELDYPADQMVLHKPGTLRVPRRAGPMFYDGKHVYAPTRLTTATRTTEEIIAQIDTGASELTLCAATGAAFQEDYTEGLESIRGIGASETLPPYRFLETTRRIPIDHLTLGGYAMEAPSPARWIEFQHMETASCSSGMRALLGHAYLAGKKVVFDYQGARFWIAKSHRKPRQVNGHARLLEQDLALHGDVPERMLYRAKLQIGLEELDEARVLLEDIVREGPAEDQPEARVLLANLHRHQGDLTAAWQAISHMSGGELVDQDEIIAAVNGLLYEGRTEEAGVLARAAVTERPDSGWSYVAAADVAMFLGDTDTAREALHRAAAQEHYPDAHLLRRARVALAHGDRYGSMAHIRRLLQLYPFGGPFLWFYALLIEDDADAATFKADMTRAMERLHPHRRPVDFLVAAHRALGDQEQADTLMREGIDMHCTPMLDDATRDNCLAWYYSLAGQHPDEALRRIDSALDEAGERSDFLDTKAMVHLARGELSVAHDAAVAAARLSPSDVYMLWQAERIGDLAAKEGP
jgi:tetratricopeptide (TPR) repeat protein